MKRLSKGVSFLAAYTWSKSIDNAKGEAGNPQNVYNLRGERGRSDWDVPHRFVLSGFFELPFHPRRRSLSMLTSGWSASPILVLSSGLPLTPQLATPVSNTGTFNRPDRIRSGVIDNPTPDRWFDTSAFVTPAQFTFGNSGRNILTGPGTHQLDINLQKDFRFTEKRYLQFRTEIFNLSNTPQFNNPNVSIGSPAAGRISGAGNSPNFTRTSRQIQFALKLFF